MKAKLDQLIGQEVSILNVAQEQGDDSKVNWYLNGKLEAPGDDGEYYVRVKECYHGSSGITFLPRHVEEVYKQPSGRWEITLK